MSDFDDALGALIAAGIALQNTITKLEIRALDDDCSEEERTLIELRIQALKLDRQEVTARADALIASKDRFKPPSTDVLQGLKKATEALAERVAQGAATSVFIELSIDLANAARNFKVGAA
jgi:hypothetical protein